MGPQRRRPWLLAAACGAGRAGAVDDRRDPHACRRRGPPHGIAPQRRYGYRRHHLAKPQPSTDARGPRKHSRAENGPRTRKARKTVQYFIRPEGATCTIELIGPAEGEGDGAAELWGLTLVCEDIDATHAALPESTKAPWDAVQKGRRMTVLQGKPHGISVACALISPRSALPSCSNC